MNATRDALRRHPVLALALALFLSLLVISVGLYVLSSPSGS